MANAEGLRELSDTEAATILGADTVRTTAGPMAWTVNDAGSEARMELPVTTSIGESLVLKARISASCPQKSHWMLIWCADGGDRAGACLRRLDLRDDHRNPDGRQWIGETHKHLWSKSVGNAVAYTPTDIPHDPSPNPVGDDDYRAIFEAFIAECGIATGPGYTWTEPPILDDGNQPPLPNWEVP